LTPFSWRARSDGELRSAIGPFWRSRLVHLSVGALVQLTGGWLVQLTVALVIQYFGLGAIHAFDPSSLSPMRESQLSRPVQSREGRRRHRLFELPVLRAPLVGFNSFASASDGSARCT
jgi:hypothetical protein